MVNTRRTTLGGISTNRRVSLAGGFESTTTTTKTSSKARKQRMSMAPRLSNNDRRSSLVPPTGTNYNRRKSVGDHHRLSSIPPPATMRSDPRSISDKVFLSKCIRNLHQYLENNGYEHQIKLKDLSRPGPSAKDFHNFMTFLLRKIDPTFNSSPKRKFEDDVVVAFKVIGYPFNISKTALVAAGSPHTWPTLLLPITWLIEVLEGGSGFSMLQEEFESIESVGAAGVTFEGVEAMETRTEKAFLKYVEVSYGSFLSGDDENAEKLEIEFLEYHEKDDVLLEHVIEKVMDENAAAEEAYNELCREGGDLPERERHLEDLANDIETFQVLIQQLTDHKTALTEKVQSSTTQLQQKEDILEKKEAKLNHLRQVIEQQQFSMEDIHKLENEVANMKETIRQTKLARQKNEDSTLNRALDLEKVFEKLHSVVEMFNSTLQELNLDDDSEQDSSYTISIQKTCADKDQSELLGGVDLKGVVMRSWHEKKNKLTQKISQLRRDLFDLTDQKEASEEAVSEMNEDIKLLVEKRRRSEDTLNVEKEQYETVYGEKQQDLHTLEENVRSLQDPGSLQTSIEKYQRQHIELESLRKQKQEDYAAIKEDVLKEFNDFMQAYATLMDYQEKVLQDLKEYKNNHRDYKIVLSERETEMLASE